MNRREFGVTLNGGALTAAGSRSPAPPWRRSAATVNGARLHAHVAEFSACGANPQGGASRVACSDADKEARAVVQRWTRDAGHDAQAMAQLLAAVIAADTHL